MYIDVMLYEVKNGYGKVFAISPEVKITVEVTDGYDYKKLQEAQNNIQSFISDELNKCLEVK